MSAHNAAEVAASRQRISLGGACGGAGGGSNANAPLPPTHPPSHPPTDPPTHPSTCNSIFTLAKERDLDLDFHTDENGNELARGLRYVAQKAIQHGYQGRVVCGHCW